MIAYLFGKLTFKSPTYIHVECSGVGHHVNISLNTYSKIENLDQAKIFTHLHVNADSHTLYGFADEQEKEMFGLLISVSGIGPNTARVILSYMTVSDVRSSILNGSHAAFNKVKGVGPKTAQRLIIDLRDKVMKLSGEDALNVASTNNTLYDEALSALVSLGFPKAKIEAQLKKIKNSAPEIENVEELIKVVLKQLR